MKKEIKLGIFLMVVFIVFSYFIIKTESCSEFFSKGKRYPIYGKFASVAGMYTTAPVRLAGVKIGIVGKIALEGRKAVVRMMINKRYLILDDARAIISTIGFVGEKYIEIVYKDEFNNPLTREIEPGGEILVIEPFNLDELKAKFDNIYERTIQITDSINDIISDKYSKESLRASFINLRSITEKLNTMLAETGQVGRVLENMDQISVKMSRTVDMVDHFVKEMDAAFADDQKGLLGDLKSTSEKIDRIAVDLTRISDDLRQGKGTAGKLLQDEELYKKIDASVSSVQSMLQDLEKKKKSLDAITFNYAVHFDYFTRLKKARSALGMDISTPGFLIQTAVNEDPLGGDPHFTALAGKKITAFSVSAGLIESDLGAALSLNMLDNRLSLDMYAYRFNREKNPLLKTMLRFSLSKNIHVQAGYYDLLQPQNREFMIGISFGN
ncbi:MAG: MlaD family protein [Candidatus Aminicenantes bacterium]|nr:MlaD family protein [Candidatus Aminicenantes bacterium]